MAKLVLMLFLIILFGGCSAYLVAPPPSPALCRDVGVAVPDGAQATGEIVEYHIVHPLEIKGKCAGIRKGCAWPVAPGEWVVYTIDDNVVRLHEECHALYQRTQHTNR